MGHVICLLPKLWETTSLVPRPVRAIRVARGGLEPSAIAYYANFPTSLTGDVTSELVEDDWERGWETTIKIPDYGSKKHKPNGGSAN